MSKKSDRIAKKAAATVKTRHKVADVAAAAASPAVAEAVAKVKKEAKPRKSVEEGGLAPLPKLPSAARARKERPSKPCSCGCGTMTKSEWAPGHDARAKGWALRIERGILKMEAVPLNEQQGAKLMLERNKANGTAKTNIKIVKPAAAVEQDDTAVNE